MEVITFGISSERLQFQFSGSTLAVKLSGVFGLRECLGALQAVRREAQRCQAVALLLDVRGVALTLTPPQYVDFMRAALDQPITRPVAFLAPKALMPWTSAHELLMLRRGLHRRFFASEAAALRWIARLPPSTPDLLG